MQKDARLKQKRIKSCMLEEIRISSDSVVERDSGKKTDTFSESRLLTKAISKLNIVIFNCVLRHP